MDDSGTAIFAGVDLGGTKIAVILADEHGSILGEAVTPTRPAEGPLQAVERTNHLLDEMCRKRSLTIDAIGIGLPGLVDRHAGTILFLPNLPEEWRGFNMTAAFASFTRTPVFLLNDARAAALGEYKFGSGAASDDLLFITIGTGVGGGLVLDGKLRLGAFGAAGEIGHQTILADGPVCGCGNRGCLETLVSGPALAAKGKALMLDGSAPGLHRLADGDPANVTATLMASAALEGDVAIADAIHSAAEFLGIGIANVVTTTAVRNVVIGGGLSTLGEMILEPARRVIKARVRMFPSEVVQVSCTALGEKCGALGAVALAAQEFKQIRRDASVCAWR